MGPIVRPTIAFWHPGADAFRAKRPKTAGGRTP